MAQPPSFYGAPTRIDRLPMPIDAQAPLRDALGDAGRSIAAAADRLQARGEQAAEYDAQTDRIKRERELQRLTGQHAAALAEQYGALQLDIVKLRSDAAPGAAGHEEQVEERIGRFRDEFVAQLGNDPELLNRFADNVANMAASVRVEETKYALVERAKQSVANGESLMSSLANNVRTAIAGGEGVEKPIANAFALWDTFVASQPLTGNAREAYARQGRALFAHSAADGLMTRDPAALIDLIDKGQLDGSGLEPNAVRQLRDRAQVLVTRAENAAETAAGESAAVDRAEARNLIEQVGEGVEVETTDLQARLARAEANPGEPEDIKLAHDLRVALARNETTIAYGGSTNAERLAARREIEAKKDWDKDEQLVAAHSQLDNLIARDGKAAKDDPLGLYVRQTGAKLGPATLGDRGAMARRFALGDRAAERYGVPPAHLTDAEAVQLRESWQTGNPGTRADLVLTLGSYGPKRGREIMRQLAPSKPELARLVELGAFRDPGLKAYVREALDGAAQPDSKAIDNNLMQATLRKEFGEVLALMPGDRRSGTVAVATMIYKHRAAQANKGGYDAALWSGSVRAALGEANGAGGIGKARGGGRFVLPVAMPQNDFDAIMAAAEPEDYRNAANGVPKWHNGRDLTLGEFQKLTPVLVRDDGLVARYGFRSGGNTVKTEGGADYLLDVRALAANLRAKRKR